MLAYLFYFLRVALFHYLVARIANGRYDELVQDIFTWCIYVYSYCQIKCKQLFRNKHVVQACNLYLHAGPPEPVNKEYVLIKFVVSTGEISREVWTKPLAELNAFVNAVVDIEYYLEEIQGNKTNFITLKHRVIQEDTVFEPMDPQFVFVQAAFLFETTPPVQTTVTVQLQTEKMNYYIMSNQFNKYFFLYYYWTVYSHENHLMYSELFAQFTQFELMTIDNDICTKVVSLAGLGQQIYDPTVLIDFASVVFEADQEDGKESGGDEEDGCVLVPRVFPEEEETKQSIHKE